jgi:hypothetical protein
MHIAIMQPYFFPYLGYFSLVNRSDRFVFLDDVFYPKKGWVNRNKILIGSDLKYFTVPLAGVSQNKKINEVKCANLEDFKSKFQKTLFHSYKKSPFFNKIYDLIDGVLDLNVNNIGDLAKLSVERVSDYIGLRTSFSNSSDVPVCGLKGQERIIQICKYYDANVYFNAEGGVALYDPSIFLNNDLILQFDLFSRRSASKIVQVEGQSVSIIDTLMNRPPDAIRALIDDKIP